MLKTKPAYVSPKAAELRQALSKAQVELDQMRAALNELSDGVVISDGQGNLLDWNPAALRLHGYSSVEQVRQHLHEFESNFVIWRLTGERVPYEDWPICKLLRDEPLDDYEVRVERTDIGQEWIIRFSGSVIKDRDGRKSLIILYLHDLTESYRAAAARQESELRLRGFVQTAVDGIVTLDESGLIESVNPAITTIFEFGAAELIGKSIELLMPNLRQSGHVGDESTEIEVALHAFNDGREIAGKKKSGGSVPLELSLGEMRLSGRRIFTGIVRDISKRRETERRLADQQSLLRTLTDAIDDPVYIKDAEGRYLFVNAALARLAGRTPEACIGANSIEIFGTDLAKPGTEIDQRIMELSTAETYEDSAQIGMERKDYLITKCRFLKSDGSVGGILGISREITRLKQAERAQRNSARHVRDVIDCLPVIVLVFGVDQHIVEMNRTAAEVIRAQGIEPQNAVNLTLDKINLVGELEETQTTLRRAIEAATKGESIRLEGLVVRRQNELSYYDLTLSPLHDADGKYEQIILSAVDITQRRAAEQQSREQASQLAHLERLQTMRHMTAGLAHELNQPLGAIANYSAAAQQKLASGAVETKAIDCLLDRITNESLRAGEIIRRMRAFVKKQRPQRVETNLNHLIRESLAIVEFEVQQRGIQIRSKLSRKILPIFVDPVQITQVIINLIRNASDALMDIQTPNRNLNLLSSRGRDQSVMLQVVDNGAGVADENYTKLFDSFFTTKQDGMGIGLPLCRMIVENHGGQIDASRNHDGGMTFRVTLPPSDNGNEACDE